MSSTLEIARQKAAAAIAKAEQMEVRTMELVGRAVTDAARIDTDLQKRLAAALKAAKMTKPDQQLVDHLMVGFD